MSPQAWTAIGVLATACVALAGYIITGAMQNKATSATATTTERGQLDAFSQGIVAMAYKAAQEEQSRREHDAAEYGADLAGLKTEIADLKARLTEKDEQIIELVGEVRRLKRQLSKLSDDEAHAKEQRAGA